MNPIVALSTSQQRFLADPQQEFVHRCWDLLRQLLGITKDSQFHPGHFAGLYTALQDPTSQQGIEFRTKLTIGGRNWLQENFRMWVSDHVRAQKFELGGMPTIHTEVDAILKLRFMRNNRWSLPWLDLSIGKTPIWAHVYTLIRMGQKSAALDYLDRYSQELAVSKDKHFRSYLSAWIESTDGRIPKQLRDRLLGDWNSNVRDFLSDPKTMPKGDAFKYALYKIIGRCEMNIKTVRNADVVATTDDYLWVQLMLLQEETLDTDGPLEKYNLWDFSLRMQQFGLAHFKTIPVWFMVLLLCGEFERAVSELLQDPYFKHDAMHFAIAMAYNGILRVPESPKLLPMAGSLISTKQVEYGGTVYPICYFHYARMIKHFYKQWIRSDTSEMLHYIYTMGFFGCALDSKKQQSASGILEKEYTRHIHQCIREVLAEFDDYSQLLGQSRSEGGGRLPGHIAIFRSLIHITSEQEFLDRIVFVAAEDADRATRFQDAVKLYDLGMQYNKAIELVNRRLGDHLLHNGLDYETTGKMTANGTQGDPVASAEKLLAFYQSRSQSASALDSKTVTTCTTLIKIALFRSLIEHNREEAALQVLYSLGLLPEFMNVHEIQKRANAFQELDESVARAMPNMMMTASQALHKLYTKAQERHASFDAAMQQSQLSAIRERSKALLMFAGLIQYRIPGDIFAKMNRLDVMMG